MNTVVDFVSGLVSGATVCLFGHIPDTVKVRMQENKLSPSLPQLGMMSTMIQIIKE